ncbi:cytochrome b-c1 complex subunit 10 [Stemphylium lycopersici]|uniref:Cytochrome b-c1 complex subunit 10 n=1 Tax=Stemphylium lycopersici TaxID=183478 RepID=A0A364N0F0_STELY|nr:cytochrome b-c1 complex subunit 10 [Stemphylium lycopersici]RAR04254.1 cytochrome b-c1 complex subunit 10 [Stemphylium lycopersici]RAR08485.1 cytochrome b-c1 complex subunit 10 [Stemphylium lycopersici]
MSVSSFAHHGKTPAAVIPGNWQENYATRSGAQNDTIAAQRRSEADRRRRYTIAKNYHGLTVGTAAKYGALAAGFGGVAGFFALFFFAEVPKVRDDIMKKIPVLDKFFTHEIPPEDNPF